ncbi:MAG: ATP-binding protein [Bacteroidales bacterium]
MENRKDTLKSVDLFRKTPSDLLEYVVHSVEEVTFEKGEVVFIKGDSVPALYIIKKGSVKVHDGEYKFATFTKYDFFGEYSLINSPVRSASVTSLEETTLLRVGEELFEKLLDEDLYFARGILKRLISRLRKSNEIEEYLVEKSNAIRAEKEEIEEKKTWLEKMNATKDQFFSIIAHDLKNPFNAIIGLSELLVYRYDNYPRKKIREFIGQIHKYSTSAYNLLDNLLQWARSQADRLVVSPQRLDTGKVIEENINLLQNKAKDKNIGIKAETSGVGDVYADQNMINTVMRNLITNAVKFTPRNGKIKVVASDKDKDYIKISVVDNGVGLDEADIPKIFDLTSHFTTNGTEAEEGTGLGMVLCKDFVEKNHGTIWVDSEKGKGSAFHFTLPKAESVSQ